MKEENYAFCDIVHNYKYFENCLVKVLKLTHENSAVQRAKIQYTGKDFEKIFFIPRDKLKKAIPVKSACNFWFDSFKISVQATFYKRENEEFCTTETAYVIEKIFCDGFVIDNIEQLEQFIGKPIKNYLTLQILSYADELPF